MPVAIGAIATAWIGGAPTGQLVAEKINREQFFESFFLTGRRSKGFKLPDGTSILTRTQQGLTTNRAAKTVLVEFTHVLFMKEVQKYECIYNSFFFQKLVQFLSSTLGKL